MGEMSVDLVELTFDAVDSIFLEEKRFCKSETTFLRFLFSVPGEVANGGRVGGMLF